MTGTALGPLPDLAQAAAQGDAGRAVVEVRPVQHLETGLAQVRVGERRQSGPLAQQRIGVETALGVGEDVEFDAAGPLPGELLGQRGVAVEQVLPAGVVAGHQVLLGERGRLAVIAVVRGHGLELGQPQVAGRITVAAPPGGTVRLGRGGGGGERRDGGGHRGHGADPAADRGSGSGSGAARTHWAPCRVREARGDARRTEPCRARAAARCPPVDARLNIPPPGPAVNTASSGRGSAERPARGGGAPRRHGLLRSAPRQRGTPRDGNSRAAAGGADGPPRARARGGRLAARARARAVSARWCTRPRRAACPRSPCVRSGAPCRRPAPRRPTGPGRR